jgi:hypothetical protein
MTPDFRELVGEEGSPEELERLRGVHDLLVAAGPPPELSPSVSEPPEVDHPAEVRVLPRRRREAALLVAAAVVAVSFGIGYLVGHRGNETPTSHLVAMHGVGTFASATGSIRVSDRDEDGNWPLDVSVSGLKKLKKGSWYELYLTAGGKIRASCGTFSAAGKETNVSFSVPYALAAYDGWVVTAHIPGVPDSGKRVLLTTA